MQEILTTHPSAQVATLLEKSKAVFIHKRNHAKVIACVTYLLTQSDYSMSNSQISKALTMAALYTISTRGSFLFRDVFYSSSNRLMLRNLPLPSSMEGLPRYIKKDPVGLSIIAHTSRWAREECEAALSDNEKTALLFGISQCSEWIETAHKSSYVPFSYALTYAGLNPPKSVRRIDSVLEGTIIGQQIASVNQDNTSEILQQCA